MGKLEWYFGGRSSSSSRDHSGRRRRRPSLPSCMSTIFHFFDFRSSHFTHFVFDNHHSSSFKLSDHRPPLLKASHHGVEAPRNSLELDGDSISFFRNKEEILQLQMLQIKTRTNGCTKSKASEQQLPNNDHIIALESPSTKTPNLLARLMGLDNLPQTSSSSSYCRGPNLGTRSLPESPRVSSSRLSDVDCHHRRLSLQLNPEKENIIICEDIKRGKEKVRRKVALVDITNSNKKIEFGKQEVGFSQSKVEINSSKKLKKMVVDESCRSKIVRRNQDVMISKKQKVISMPMKIPKRRVREGEAFDCPTSNDLILINLNHSTIFPVKKEPSPATKVPREQPCSNPKGGDGGETNAVDSSTTTTTGGGAASQGNPNWVPPNSTFHHLETTAAPEEQRWNKRLVLHLAVEYSAGGGEILNKKSWHVRRGMKGCEFPRAKCEVVEHMKDLEKSKRIMAEETEGIVKVVELHILDSLLRETIAIISSPTKTLSFY